MGAAALVGAAVVVGSAAPGAASPGAASPGPGIPLPPAGGALYQDLGAGIRTVLLSDPYPGGARVLWACGTSIVAKLDAESFDVIATLRRPGGGSDDSGRRERVIAAIDAGPGSASDGAAAAAPAPPDGPAPLLDADNRLIVSGERSLLAYGDAERGTPSSGIREVQRFELPASIPGRFTGLVKAPDGHLIGTTSAGFVVSVARGFSRLATARLPHAPARDESEAWVRGGPIVDDRGGVYVATAHHLHRVAWDGANLSTAPEAGAWSEEVRGGCAPGVLPVFPGGGPAGDRLVAVATAGDPAGVAAFWRDDPPASQPAPDSLKASSGPPAPRSRLAAEAEIPLLGDHGPGAGDRPGKNGNGAHLFASPEGVLASAGAGGLAGLRWDSGRRSFDRRFSSELRPGGGVVLSPDGGTVYFLASEEHLTSVYGFDTKSAGPPLRRALGGARFLPRGAAPILDPQGRFVSGCLFGVLRAEVGP